MLPVLQRGAHLNPACRPDFAHLTDGQAMSTLVFHRYFDLGIDHVFTQYMNMLYKVGPLNDRYMISVYN